MITPFAENLESTLDEHDTQVILEILGKIGIQHWLSDNPFKEIKFVNQSYLLGNEVNGWYSYQTRETEINVTRNQNDWGQSLDWGQVYSLSQTGRSRLEAVQFTVLHELGHHIHAMLYQNNANMFRQTMMTIRSNAVSNYAKTPQKPVEYFAETFVAWVLYRVELFVNDQLGYGIIQRALKALSIEVNEYDFNQRTTDEY